MPDAPDLSPHRAQANAFVTAGAWNALCEAILGAYACLNAAQAVPGYLVISVRRRDTDAVLDPAAVASIAARSRGSTGPAAAARRVGRHFVVDGLPPGDYDVTATAAPDLGLAPETRPATVRAGAPTEMTFSLAPPPVPLVAVPDLFRRPLGGALDSLVEAGLRPGAVLDAHGTQVNLLQIGDRWQPAQEAAAQLLVVNLEPGVGAPLARGLPVDLLVTATPEPAGP
ncbi:MAG TPA: hypothetical protein VNK05_12445 [Chloroflexota bacterium]|jgi:hypothetical protein|nr:hypothetical protein [Chloroflexota bacterium]